MSMLPLDSPAWSNLRDAYGSAASIPGLLQQLHAFPADNPNDEPWFTIWSALAHQGDIYSASFAAVPHVVDVLAKDPKRATPSFFHFPAWVEICRQKAGADVPSELSDGYFAALARMPDLVGAAASRDWDDDILQCALAAFAAGLGRGPTAEAILELSPDVASKFLDWFHDQ
jgi:hypothetical protein